MASMRLVFRVHALTRMSQRGIDEDAIRRVLKAGETIENYPDDTPYPSRLVHGWVGSRPVHIVAADNPEGAETIIITVYEPGRDRWEEDFRRRREP